MSLAVRLKSLMLPEESTPQFAKRLDHLAEEKGIPARYPVETVREWLTGYRRPHLDTFHELAHVLGVSPLWLYDGTGPQELDAFNAALQRVTGGEEACPTS